MSSASGGSRPKPWERQVPTEVTSSPAAESSAKPWEVPRDRSNASLETVVPETSAGPVQQPGSRPWETRGALSSTMPANNSVGAGMYGGYGGGGYGNSMYGGYGNSTYGGYGNSMYGGYGNSMYGGYGSGGYGGYGYNGGMYGARPMFGGGVPVFGGANPMVEGGSSPWQTMLGGIGSMVHFFGRLSFLVDENAHAVHFFISALLQLLDRFGSLYGELARFILRLLGLRGRDAEKEQITTNPVRQETTFDKTWAGDVR